MDTTIVGIGDLFRLSLLLLSPIIVNVIAKSRSKLGRLIVWSRSHHRHRHHHHHQSGFFISIRGSRYFVFWGGFFPARRRL